MLDLLKEKGAWIVGAEADGDVPPWSVDMTGPTVIRLIIFDLWLTLSLAD